MFILFVHCFLNKKSKKLSLNFQYLTIKFRLNMYNLHEQNYRIKFLNYHNSQLNIC